MKSKNNRDDEDRNNKNIILSIDIGSSSVRATAYRYRNLSTMTKTTNYSDDEPAVDVVAIPNCSSSISIPAVEPTTGTIRTDKIVDAVESSIDNVLEKLRAQFNNSDFQVEAMGFTTFVMNLVAVTNDGQTNSNVSISYACNAPAVNKECQYLRKELGPEELDRLYQSTGAPLHSAYAIPQLRTLFDHRNRKEESKAEPESEPFNNNYQWQSITGYCLSRWYGGHRVYFPLTYSEASWTGLLNVHDCVYEESALSLLPSECCKSLPELADFSQYVVGIPKHMKNNNESNDNEGDHKNNDGTGGNSKSVINPYFAKWVELRRTKFFLGVGDGAAANIGSKCTTTNRIAVTIGTSAAARICLQHDAKSSSSSTSSIDPLLFKIPECRGLFCYRIDEKHVLIGGALTDGGSVIEWASRLLNLDKDDISFQKCLDEARHLITVEYKQQQQQQQQQQMKSEEKSCRRDLIMVPFLSGERSTGFRDGASGAVFGLTRETTPAIFMKSCLEGVSLRLKAILDLLLKIIDSRSIDENDTVIVASGKALERNDILRQMVADCSGRCVLLDADSTTEGTSRGVALLVAISLAKERAKAENDDCSLILAKYEEPLRPFISSKPTRDAKDYYDQKARSQENFIDSISSFFGGPL